MLETLAIPRDCVKFFVLRNAAEWLLVTAQNANLTAAELDARSEAEEKARSLRPAGARGERSRQLGGFNLGESR